MTNGFGRSLKGTIRTVHPLSDNGMKVVNGNVDIGVTDQGLIAGNDQWTVECPWIGLSLETTITSETNVDSDLWLSLNLSTEDGVFNVTPMKPSALLSRLERYGSCQVKMQTKNVWTAFEKKRIRTPLTNILILLGLILIFFIIWNSLTAIEHHIVDSYVPVSAGKALAKMYLPQFTSEKEKGDPKVIAAVESVGRRIIENLPDRSKLVFAPEITFHVVRDPSINAFALPGGHVIVFTGLIKACENEDQLAIIIAHELSHVINRDGLKAVISQIKWQILLSLIAGDIGADQEMLLNQVKNLSSLRYSRKVEQRADLQGLELVDKSKYNIHCAPRFFEIMARNDHYQDYMLTFMSDHPATQDRIDELTALANEMRPSPVEGKKSVPDWTEIRNLAAN